ncbi:MAG: hypothetical protein P8M72_13565 [Gammaproteobacteria bacterium]|nr:hypothetical protein [Gammaproteobacteria bacterium]
MKTSMEAVPQSSGTWQFQINEGVKPVGSLIIDEWADSGLLKVHGNEFTVKLSGHEFYEQSVLKGKFQLERNGKILISANKKTALQIFFELEVAGRNYILRPSSILRRHIVLS